MSFIPDDTPKLTPSLLRAHDTMCPRRLALEFRREPGTKDPVNRSRVRNAILDSIRTWHESGRWPPVRDLCSEERAVVTQAVAWYERRFPDRGVHVELPLEEPTLLPRRGVLLAGWVGLGVIHPDGSHELRQLHWSRAGQPDLMARPEVRLAVLRLAAAGWWERGSLRVTDTDLVTGAQVDAEVEGPEALAPLACWLDEQMGQVRDRADEARTESGAGCATCHYVPRCPAHDVRGSMTSSASALLPGVLSLSPTSFDAWQCCRRQWRDRSLLAVTPTNPPDSPTHGLYLHRLLHQIHRRGSCHDVDHVRDVLAGHGADERTTAEVARHARRCPIGAEAVGHEVEWARTHRGPPVFVTTCRLDAVWAHDGILDVRDYKSGRVIDHRVSEDPRAWLQAWVAAREAAARGLRLRIRYEHLAAEVEEDPEPWEPTDEELVGVEQTLVTTAQEMRAEHEFRGVSDDVVCGRCQYRGGCDDAAVKALPAWPRPADDVPAGAPS
ncbi:MAG TPA: PD-(D/E)XK nuclease family protein [Acidimicrobiia bacterium]